MEIYTKAGTEAVENYSGQIIHYYDLLCRMQRWAAAEISIAYFFKKRKALMKLQPEMYFHNCDLRYCISLSTYQFQTQVCLAGWIGLS